MNITNTIVANAVATVVRNDNPKYSQLEKELLAAIRGGDESKIKSLDSKIRGMGCEWVAQKKSGLLVDNISWIVNDAKMDGNDTYTAVRITDKGKLWNSQSVMNARWHKVGDAVIVTEGKFKGNTGKVSRFMPCEMVEIITADGKKIITSDDNCMKAKNSVTCNDAKADAKKCIAEMKKYSAMLRSLWPVIERLSMVSMNLLGDYYVGDARKFDGALMRQLDTAHDELHEVVWKLANKFM